MNYKKFLRFSAFYLTIFLFLLLLILFINSSINLILFSSFTYALLISFVNFLIGFFSINYGMMKNDKLFLIIVFGAIIFRFFTVFLVIIGVLSFLDVRADYFIFTTFILYFYYLVIEILYLKNLKKVEN